ncbi:hypothetical protein [Nocardioides massiliensis]|uniref:Uncharacterized protein n=1 Tax=Nocardioides massiliensis TaxID=1325935 RepID=A0ABT9NQT9_9ACTN|nr:hypothetical protein [Nocardioides massiliensis]MDP9822790.1 hypothetical protein [Nocardioides massiliensis]
MSTRPKDPTRCSRCSKKYRGRGDWNSTYKQGICIGLLCPACQTPEENAEAAINEATLDYGRGGFDAFGRQYARSKEGTGR